MPSTRRVQWMAAISAGVLTAAMAAPAGAEEATDRDTGAQPVAATVSGAAPRATVEDEIDVDNDSLKVLGVYPILDDDTISADADPGHLAVFERFSEVIPADLRPEVTHFVAIDQERSDGTDGAMDLPADEDGMPIEGQYYIALDTTGSSDGATLERTMVHEFGHLVTLRPGQAVQPTAEEWEAGDVAACPILADAECPTEDSYLAAYYAAFPGRPDAEFDPDVYATEYAATHPLEDVAEVFAEWVLNDTEPPVVNDGAEWREVEPGSVLDIKLDFFERYPELVAARVAIRDGIKRATPNLDIGWPLASIPRELARDCSTGPAASEVEAWKVASCPWNDGEAQATYVFFRTESDLADWWQNERADVPRKDDLFRRCKSGEAATGVWNYEKEPRAGRMVCDLVGPTGQAKLAWTHDDLLVGVRVVSEAANLKRLVNRWGDGDFDVNW